MKYITFLNLGIKIFFTICIFSFIRESTDYWLYPLFQSLGYIFAGLAGQYILVKRYRVQFSFLSFKIIRNTILENFPIFVNRFLPTLYNNTSTLLLGLMVGNAVVGKYDAIKKVIDLSITLLNTVSRVFFPFLNRRNDAFDRYRKMMLIISVFLMTMVIGFNKFVFYYLNIEDINALYILIILAVGIVAVAVYDIYGMNYFIIKRKDKLVMNNTVTASIIGFVLSFPLIYYWGILGAAVNLSLSRWLMGGGLYVKYLQAKK